MLILVFIFDYVLGEVAFELFNSNPFYFIAVSSIDAYIVKYLTTANCGDRAKKYAILSITSVCLHFIGSQIYMFNLDNTFYVFGLWIILLGKLMLLDKALSDAGKYTLCVTSYMFNRVVCSSYRLAYT